jgi:hypothetical protein
MKIYQMTVIIAVLTSLLGCKPAPAKQDEVVNVTMPNGAVIRDVPVGTSKAEILKKLQSAGYDTAEMLKPASPRSYPTATPNVSISPSSGFFNAPDPSPPPFKGRVQLNYGSSRYGDPTSRYRGEVESDGSVRLRNFDGDVMRGYVDPDGSVRLRSYGGDTYRGSVDSDGSMRLRNFDGSEMSGRIEPDGY